MPDNESSQKGTIPTDNIQSPELVTAQGNVKIRITAIIVVGVVILVLLLGGLYAYITDPTHAKDLWLIIGPIISAAISGLVGFEIGQKTK